jgi:hypothetical protein
MTTFHNIVRDGVVWLVVRANDRMHWLHPQARVGDCYCPGQRMNQHMRVVKPEICG